MSSFSLSPLRYPGGKGKLGPWLGELMRHNNISGGSYIEPYAGGAGAALYLLFSGYVNHIVINDADKAIYAMWYSIIKHTDVFLNRLRDTVVGMDSWLAQKEIIENPDEHDLVDLGFAAFFLNRTNVSGVIKGGVIGGKQQQGKYKIDARFNKTDLVKRIERIAGYKNSIDVYNEDAMNFISNTSGNFSAKSMIYFDPPYYVKGSQLYRNHYHHDDHKAIAEKIQTIQHPRLVTYDNCEPIKGFYDVCESGEFSLRYSASRNTREVATELIFYGNMDLHCLPSLVTSS